MPTSGLKMCASKPSRYARLFPAHASTPFPHAVRWGHRMRIGSTTGVWRRVTRHTATSRLNIRRVFPRQQQFHTLLTHTRTHTHTHCVGSACAGIRGGVFGAVQLPLADPLESKALFLPLAPSPAVAFGTRRRRRDTHAHSLSLFLSLSLQPFLYDYAARSIRAQSQGCLGNSLHSCLPPTLTDSRLGRPQCVSFPEWEDLLHCHGK